MTLNEILTRQNVITKIVLQEGDKELSKQLKVKLMRIRMAYNKIKKSFDSELQEFTEELLTDEFKELSNKSERSSEEETRLNELTTKFNTEYQEFLIQKGNEEVATVVDDSFTMDEYSEIVDVNSGNDTEINGTKVSALDLLDIVSELFVKE